MPGAREHAVAVKPVAQFYSRWQALQQQLANDGGERHIAVAGGGAAGVELILAMHHALAQQPQLHFHLLQKGEGQPENYPPRLQQKAARLLRQRRIQVHEHFAVARITDKSLAAEDGRSLAVDHLFWCTNGRASRWPGECGLSTDADGFIGVNDQLQSASHEFVFAAGDIARQQGQTRPRAGVFAVRQGPVLFENLRRALLQQPLKAFRPQKAFLSLLACGDRYALGCRLGVNLRGSPLPSIAGTWVWRWKDRIDRRFMTLFNRLTAMPVPPAITQAQSLSEAISGEQHGDLSNHAMRCGGCGAKVGASVLNRVINQLQPIAGEGVVLGLQAPDDASAIKIPPQQLLLQSVDSFRTLIDDPFIQGQIAANHALSDLFAMNATPHSALAIATLPYGGDAILERDLLQLMSGALDVLNKNGCALIGGHTSEGAELSLGFAVNGLASENQLLQKSHAKAGQRLILTQALGTGTLFAAHSQLKAKGAWIEAAIDAMQQSNRRAGEIFFEHGAGACTDITGFGLIGHLAEILKPAGVSATLYLDSIPALDGALTCLQGGIASSLQPQNIRLRRAIADQTRDANHPVYPLLFDPQTSGGLLACVPAEHAEACLAVLHEADYRQACVIGDIVDGRDDLIELR